MGAFGGKIEEGVVRYTRNELVLPFGVVMSVPISVKIDQEMQCDCESARRRIHRLTETN